MFSSASASASACLPLETETTETEEDEDENVKWYIFNCPRASPSGLVVSGNVVGAKPPRKGCITVSVSVLSDLPYRVMEIKMHAKKRVPLDFRKRTIDDKFIRSLLKETSTDVSHSHSDIQNVNSIGSNGSNGSNGIVKKRKRVKVSNVAYDSVTSIDDSILEEFPWLRWAFWEADYPLLKIYPAAVICRISSIHRSQILDLLNKGEDCVHLWPALSKRIDGLPYFISEMSKPLCSCKLERSVLLARNVWKRILDEYCTDGVIDFGDSKDALMTTKLFEWGLITEEGKISRWEEQETEFKGFLKSRSHSVKILIVENTFSPSYYDAIDTLIDDGSCEILYPGTYMKGFHEGKFRRVRMTQIGENLSNYGTSKHIIILMSERVTMEEWNYIFSCFDSSKKITMIGDPKTKIRVHERGSPMHGFSLVCDSVEDGQRYSTVSWPMIEIDNTMCWQYEVQRALLNNETIYNATIIARNDAIQYFMNGLKRSNYGKGVIGDNVAILCFDEKVYETHIFNEGKNITYGDPVFIPTLGEAGKLVRRDVKCETAWIGKKAFDVSWPHVLARMNMCMAHRYIGGPVDDLFLIINSSTKRSDISSMLKYAIKNLTIVMETERSADFRMLPD